MNSMYKEKLPQSEEIIMLVVWRGCSSPVLSNIMDTANKEYHKNWKPQTVSTFLHRLIEKGYLTYEKIGRYTHYYPAVSLEVYQKNCLLHLMRVVYANNTSLLKKHLSSLQ